MATRQEIMAALRKADAAGDAAGAKRLVAMLDAVPPEDPANDQGFLQQMFDVRNAETGESYLYGNTPNPTGFDDVTRIMADTATRGYGDKTAGVIPRVLGYGEEAPGGARALTDAARERTPLPVELASDITAAVASSPYRMGSTLAGGAFGAAEGAARSYGNQEGWVPDVPEITKDAAYGAMLGAGGQALPVAWNAAKTGLGKVSGPNLTSAAIDFLTTGMPWLTGGRVAAKGLSKLPGLPAGDVSRDLLSKALISQGPR